jgi:hypothetical protein
MERYQPKAALAPEPEPAPVPAAPVPNSKPERVLCFVCLPNKLLKRPPIRYRDEGSKVGLLPFEFVIGATCAGLARAKLVALRHAEAFAAAGKAIRRLRHGKKAMWKFGQEGFTSAGLGVYDNTKNAFEYTGATIKLELSQRELFRAAGLSRKARNLARLPAALSRLTKPVPGFAPVLQNWELLPSGRIRLEVDNRWVPRSHFGRVPWPPPANGPAVLAFYLFAFGTDMRPDSRTSIDIEILYRLLGIPLTCSAHTARSLNRALDHVNEHLKGLNAEGALDKHELPHMFEILPIANGTRVHIRPVVAEIGVERDHHERPDFDDDDVEVEDDEAARYRQFWRQHDEQQKHKWAAEVEREEREREGLKLALWGRT